MATARMDTVIRQLRGIVWREDEDVRTDGQLLAAFIDRQDETSFAVLARRHSAMVFGVCRRIVGNYHDAEDAFQAAFLVLARKASTVAPRERLANWLHGVALRTALKAKALAGKRRAWEKQVAEMPEAAAAQPDQGCDLQPQLDQQLNGLPEKYRLPILLCDLEGKTIKEATEQLGWPQGTLAGRLARGRKLLAKRLVNRWGASSAGALAAAVAQDAASAAVPVALMNSTVRAAATIAAGRAMVAGMVPAKVAILTEGVLKAMVLTKLKTLTVGFLLVALLVSAAGAFYQVRAAEQPKGEQKTSTAGGSYQEALFTVDAAKPLKGEQKSSPAQEIPPPAEASPVNYLVVAKLMETDADQPKVIFNCPRITFDNEQLCHLHLTDGPRNLLAKVIEDENIKIGTFLDFRVKALGGNKARLFLSFQRNEVEEASVSEIRVLGNNVQTVQDVELHVPVKVVFLKDAKGSARRWIELTVDEQEASPPVVRPQPRDGKK